MSFFIAGGVGGISVSILGLVVYNLTNTGGKKLRKAEYEAGFSDGEKSGHETGFSEGHKSGFSEGQNHAAIETARRMLQSNKFTIEEIAKFSGLSQQEVETISSDA